MRRKLRIAPKRHSRLQPRSRRSCSQRTCQSQVCSQSQSLCHSQSYCQSHSPLLEDDLTICLWNQQLGHSSHPRYSSSPQKSKSMFPTGWKEEAGSKGGMKQRKANEQPTSIGLQHTKMASNLIAMASTLRVMAFQNNLNLSLAVRCPHVQMPSPHEGLPTWPRAGSHSLKSSNWKMPPQVTRRTSQAPPAKSQSVRSVRANMVQYKSDTFIALGPVWWPQARSPVASFQM